MNAGKIDQDHWVHDPEIGGGRLLGEACHFIDLAAFLSGAPITEVCAVSLRGIPSTDTASILLRHANGSTAVVNYFANGHRELSKERIEVHAQGRSLVLDNFRELRGYGFRSFSRLKIRQDKGHRRQFALFAERLAKGGSPLIPWCEVVNSTRATLAVLRSLESHSWVAVDTI
jgi:predicted dehydrogenase